MTSLIHRCFCAEGSISFPPSSPTSIRSCFPIRLCFHSSDNAVSVSKPKSKKVTRIEETVAFDSQKFASHEVAVSTNACKSVALATEQRGNAYGALYLDRSHAFDISETDLLRLRRARLSELENFLIHHADLEPSHGNHDGLETSHIGDSKGGCRRGGGESSHVNEGGESAFHSDHDRVESSRHEDEDESSHSDSNEIESAHGNYDAGESFLCSQDERESSHLDLKEDKLLRRHSYKNEHLHRHSHEEEPSHDHEHVMLLNNVLGKLEKEGLNNPIGTRAKKGSFTSYTRKGENVAVRSSKRAERLAKRRRANSKSRKEVVPDAFVGDMMSVRKSVKSKKVPFQQPQIDPIRSFLMSNGSTKKELLSQAEEVQLSHKIQDFLALEVIKESLESQIGRRATLSEWANAAEMDISTFSKRLNEGHQSKNRMIQCNLRLVISVARKYEGKGLSLEDLIQEGSMGLIRGCEKFDPERGFKFCTYAYWWIKQAVMRALFENSRLIRLPAHVVETMLRIGKVRRLLWQKNGVVPSNSDIAKVCGISVEKLKIVTKAVKYCKSMDKPVGKDMNLHLGDILPDLSLESPELRITRDLLRADLDGVLMTLNPREEVIVRLRFGLDDGKKRTLAEIAKVFHVTRERIRQIESRALRKLRQPQRNECLRGMVEGQVNVCRPRGGVAHGLRYECHDVHHQLTVAKSGLHIMPGNEKVNDNVQEEGKSSEPRSMVKGNERLQSARSKARAKVTVKEEEPRSRDGQVRRGRSKSRDRGKSSSVKGQGRRTCEVKPWSRADIGLTRFLSSVFVVFFPFVSSKRIETQSRPALFCLPPLPLRFLCFASISVSVSVSISAFCCCSALLIVYAPSSLFKDILIVRQDCCDKAVQRHQTKRVRTMSGRKTSGKAGANNAGISIPPSERKVISSLKEVVPHSEEEIYAMFTECNRDPDETVQRLLSEETFHIVQRKQNKKKEPIKDSTGAQQGSGSFYDTNRKTSRSSRSRESGRVSSVPKGYGSAETNGVSSKVIVSKEIGVSAVVNIKGPSSAVGGTISYSQLVQTKTSSYTNSFENPIPSRLPNEHVQAVPSQGPLPVCSSGPPALQGAWLGSGRGTVADLLKSKSTSNAPLSGNPMPSNTASEYHSTQRTYLGSADVLNSSNPPVGRSTWPVKEDNDTVGTQWSHVDRSSFTVQDTGAHLQHNVSSGDNSVALAPNNISMSGPLEEETSELSALTDGKSYVVGISEAADAQTVTPRIQFTTTSFQTEQLVDVVKESPVVEKSYQEVTTEESPPIEASPIKNEAISSIEVLSATTEKLQRLNVRETQQVIIPDHIRVSEEECTMLSFGSFDFGQLPSNSIAEKESISPPLDEDTDEEDVGVTSGSPASSTANVNSARSDGEEAGVSASAQKLDAVGDASAVLNNEAEIKTDENYEQAQSQHAYTSGYSMISQPLSEHLAQYPTEVTGTRQAQDMNTVLQQPYDNSTYYSGMFRMAPEADARYSAFLPTATNVKISAGSRPAPTIQNASPQEAANAATTVFSNSTSIGGQNMQVLNSASPATTLTLPQQASHPVYATQPSGMPMGPFANVFSYQYMPPGFSYLQSPYQQGYLGSGNYQQVPSTVGAGIKYPLPQYKQGGAIVGGMHTTMNPGNLGYGGYNNALSQPGAFPVNPQGTPRNPSSYDEAPSPQFKETNVYMPTQQAQMEGPSVWLQSQSARELPNSSYYNGPSQNQQQQTRYSHQTPSIQTHIHPGAAGAMYGGNVYHHQQSGSSPSAHQLLQQQGPVGALGTRIGSYQQGQRSQQSWANGI